MPAEVIGMKLFRRHYTITISAVLFIPVVVGDGDLAVGVRNVLFYSCCCFFVCFNTFL